MRHIADTPFFFGSPGKYRSESVDSRYSM
jgi:hypothetical protein